MTSSSKIPVILFFVLFVFPYHSALAAPTDLAWSTLLGGSGHEWGQAIALDEKGYLYVAGQTASLDFPTTPGAFNAASPGKTDPADPRDLFIVKLHPSGSGLVYATLLGGGLAEDLEAIAVDGSDNLCLTGTTWSKDFPITAGALQAEYHGGTEAAGDVFVAKLNGMGTGLIYSTFLGGDKDDRATGIALDGSENIYLTGQTRSPDFPVTTGAFHPEYGGGDGDAFVTKLDVSGNLLLYSTFLGSSGADRGSDIAVDRSGHAWVCGRTDGSDFPITAAAGDSGRKDTRSDAFLTKFNPDGRTLAYSTRLGGNREEEASCVAIDPSGCAYLAGRTLSPDFPTTEEAFDRSPNHRSGVLEGDGFVAKYDAAGNGPIYATHLGGPGPDEITGMVPDAAGSVYLCGQTEGAGFPTTAGAFDTAFGGQMEAFFALLDPSGSRLIFSTLLGGRGRDRCSDLVLDGAGNVFLTGWTESGDFPIVSQALRSVHHGRQDVFVVRFGAAAATAEPVPRGGSLPSSYALFQNYPNPFNGSTVIRFDLPRDGHVGLRIYDTLGREQRVLLNRRQKGGGYTISWDGRDDHGKVLTSGVYFCKVESGGFEDVVKMVMMR